MRDTARRSVASVAVLSALAVILLVLAVLQYRWISQVSEADRGRIQAALENSVRQFRQEFNRELLNLCLAASQPDPRQAARDDLDSIAERLQDSLQTTAYPALVSQVYLWDAEVRGDPHFLRLNHDTRRFEAAAWPANWSELRQQTEDFPFSRRRFRLGDGRVFVWTVVNGEPVIVYRLFMSTRRREEFRREEVEQRRAGREPREERRDSPDLARYLLIALDAEFLKESFLPELVQRYFHVSEEFDYHVAVVSEENPNELIYQSSAELSAATFSSADARVDLLWEPRFLAFAGGEAPPPGPETAPDGRQPPPEEFGPLPRGPGPPGRGEQPSREGPPRGFRGPGPWPENPPPGFGFRGGRAPAFLFSLEGKGWELAVKHQQGSLDLAVASLRRRNLAISFGVLLLLAASVGMIYVSAQRARRLANLQMEFVAGVSHELRTPLAVIQSAADNLAEGVIASQPQVQEYGNLIRNESRRLATMIEQTLQFAATQTGAPTSELGAVAVEPLIERTLRDLNPAVRDAGFELETTIEPGLPNVRSNEEALSRVLANLVQNALKYGGEARWIAVRARPGQANGSNEVEIRVEDHGPGIDSDDLPHIFEPFYRGKLALSNQIQGSGLGLNLAQKMSLSIGARLTVESSSAEGTAFTIHLPVDNDAQS